MVWTYDELREKQKPIRMKINVEGKRRKKRLK
jgi:hypothetical protein